MPSSDFVEVNDRANALPYGLSSFCFTSSSSLAMKTEARLDAGLVGVNHMIVATPQTPFGGVNASGFGTESSIESLEAFQGTQFVTEFAL